MLNLLHFLIIILIINLLNLLLPPFIYLSLNVQREETFARLFANSKQRQMSISNFVRSAMRNLVRAPLHLLYYNYGEIVADSELHRKVHPLPLCVVSTV